MLWLIYTSIGDADTLSTAQTDELSDSTCLSDVTVVHNRPHLVDPVLSSIKVFRLKGDNNTLKGIVSAMEAVESANALLWDCCKNFLLNNGLVFLIDGILTSEVNWLLTLMTCYNALMPWIRFLLFFVRLLIY